MFVQTGSNHCRHTARCRRERDIDRNQHGCSNIGFTGKRQLASGIKAVPANPEYEYTRGGQCQAVSGQMSRFIVFKSANAGADDNRCGQGSKAPDTMNDDRTGKIIKTQRVKPATAPFPESTNGINQRGNEQAVEHL